MGVICSLIAHAQSHKQFAKFELSNVAVWIALNCFTELRHCFLRSEVDAQGHTEHDANLGHIRELFYRRGKRGDEIIALGRLENAGISKHSLKRPGRFWSESLLQGERICGYVLKSFCRVLDGHLRFRHRFELRTS